MYKIDSDIEYNNIVQNILENEEFNKIKKIEHHGISRFDHSLKVSYYAYRVAKFLKLDINLFPKERFSELKKKS